MSRINLDIQFHEIARRLGSYEHLSLSRQNILSYDCLLPKPIFHTNIPIGEAAEKFLYRVCFPKFIVPCKVERRMEVSSRSLAKLDADVLDGLLESLKLKT